jgi:hypothetical protein
MSSTSGVKFEPLDALQHMKHLLEVTHNTSLQADMSGTTGVKLSHWMHYNT